MGVNADFVGRTFALPHPYDVEAPVLRAFAQAIGATHPACFDPAAARALGYRDIVAAPTFAVVIAQAAEALYLTDPAARIDFTHVLHAEERFVHTRPLVAGDRVTATLEVLAITTRAALTRVTTRTHVTVIAPTADAAPAVTVYSTLAIREPTP